ncbi:T9SS type A sorting domain-containing protein [Rubrivirga sp.]|uniref:T9SS type A sorting domain-containing protein n=1 Tax=Rubrivirga sp. TaxID=1885344 RepID=UPI003B519D65
MTPFHRSAARLVLVAAAASLALAAGAQTAPTGAWSDVFAYPGVRLSIDLAPYNGGDAVVEAVEPDGNGGVYVAGRFDTVDGVAVTSVAHWDGQAWRSLGRGLTNGGTYSGGIPTVNDLLLASDGSLYVAGQFTGALQANGRAVLARSVVRWTGTAWEPLGGGLLNGDPFYYSATAGALAEGPDGAIYVGGIFDSAVGADGQPVGAKGVAVWADGVWADLPALGTSAVNVEAIAVREDGTVALGGTFDGAGYYSPGLLLYRPDGTTERILDGTYGVTALAWVDGALYAGGTFDVWTSDVDGVVVRNVARWRDGQWDGLEGGTSGPVYGIEPDGAGGVYVVGAFAWAGTDSGAFPEPGGPPSGTSVAAGGVARWDGTAWSGEGTVTPIPTPYWYGTGPRSVAVVGGDLVIGGLFDGVRGPDGSTRNASGVAIRRAGAWGPLSRFGGEAALGRRQSVQYVAPSVRATAPNPCGAGVLVAGHLETIGTADAASVALWDGAAWRAIPGTLSAYGSVGTATALAPAGCAGGQPRFFVAGAFSSVLLEDGTALDAPGVAYWDGTAWSALAGTAPEGEVKTLAYDGQTLVAGGALTRSGVPAVFSWAPGRGWQALGRVDGTVYALTYGPDGALYVGGVFSSVQQPNGLTLQIQGLVRWSGTEWTWIGSPTYGEVRALAFGPDGTLYAGGSFDRFEQPSRPDTPARQIAAWDGTSWTDAGDPGVAVSALAVGAGGRIYAGYDPAGSGYYSGTETDRLLAFGDDGWEGLGVREGGVTTLTLLGADLYVGGTFRTAGPTPSAYLGLYVDPQATPTASGPAPSAFALTVAPNPVRDRAVLTVEVPAAGPVRAAVYDALGREVAVLWDGARSAGPLALDLDAARLPAGVYVARVQTGGSTATRTLTVVR